MVKKTLAFEFVPEALYSGAGMIELDQLDSADIKHDRCPVCKGKELNKQDGFKVCPRCGSNFKALDGKSYLIECGGEIKVENRKVTRLRKVAEGPAVDMEKLKAIPADQLRSTVRGCYTIDLDDEDAVESYDPTSDEAYSVIWDKIQDNYDVCTDPNNTNYLDVTSEVKNYIDQLDLIDAATEGMTEKALDDAKENFERRNEEERKEQVWQNRQYERDKI